MHRLVLASEEQNRFAFKKTLTRRLFWMSHKLRSTSDTRSLSALILSMHTLYIGQSVLMGVNYLAHLPAIFKDQTFTLQSYDQLKKEFEFILRR